jgi:hypothetical protein
MERTVSRKKFLYIERFNWPMILDNHDFITRKSLLREDGSHEVQVGITVGEDHAIFHSLHFILDMVKS